MASITSLMSSSSSGGIYGSRSTNIISGLATGMDTESMIEGAVQGYQAKITELEQDRTMAQWKQVGYQEISDMLVDFSREYTSYTSSTNLLSAGFFGNSSVTNPMGDNAGAVTAHGDSSSNILINSITKLATAQQYAISATSLIGSESSSSGGKTTVSTGAVDLSGNTTVSSLEGSLTLKYGTRDVKIDFGEFEFFDAAGDGSGTVDAQALADAINEKLADENISFTSGDSKAANEVIKATVDAGGNIVFEELGTAGNGVSIDKASGKLATTLGLTDIAENQKTISTLSGDYSEEVNTMDYLKGETLSFEFDGSTKNITIGEDWTSANFADKLQAELNNAYGSNKVQVGRDGDKFTFSVNDGSTLSVDSSAAKVFGISENGGASSTLNINKTLGELGFTGEQTLTINGVDIGTFNADSTMEEVLTKINGNDESGFKVFYSEFSGEFLFTAEETGVSEQITFGGSLGTALFGDPATDGRYIAGEDAQLNVTVNGQTKDITRSSNTVDIDGMEITLKDTFTAGEAIEFTTEVDSDPIVDAIKSMIDDYNAIVSKVKTAYTEQPLETSSGEAYRPLIDEDKASMSESEIEAYEEKVKTGQFFMDSDLRGLSDALRDAITSLGATEEDLADIGIGISYSSGLTTLTLDESALRNALESEPEKVEEIFTRRESTGGSSNGLMASLLEVTEKYAKETGEPKGILIELAGSQHSPTSVLQNDMLTLTNSIDDQIEMWQDKLTDRVDYYTRQFTQLEVLMMEMNNQSSYFSGMMG